MKAIPITLFVIGALFLAFSIGKRFFGAYGFSPDSTDAVGFLMLAGIAWVIWGPKAAKLGNQSS